MISERLYFTDAYAKRFKAHVVERLDHYSSPAVILDRSLFYPESGGQPHDTGEIDEIAVVRVFVRESDQAIVHVLPKQPASEEVTGQIDWSRRFDHMQQHTGQHLLSKALLVSAAAETLSFHLGKNESTIDVDKADIEDTQFGQAELLSNQIIWENRPVKIQFADPRELENQPLRSNLKVKRESTRLVNIDEFDITPCGGTHVAYTGEIGLIKIVKSERLRGGTRLTFVCGQRALKDFQFKNYLVNQLASDFTTSASLISQSVAKLFAENKKSKKEFRQLQKEYFKLESEKYLAAATKVGSVNVVCHQFINRDPEDLRLLANTLCRNEETIVLFGLGEPSLRFVFSKSGDAPGDMNSLLAIVIETFSSARGGGSEKFAQASGPPANSTRINKALMEAQQYLVEVLR